MSDSVEPSREPDGGAPRVLQVLPALGEGGAERDTLDLADGRPMDAVLVLRTPARSIHR